MIPFSLLILLISSFQLFSVCFCWFLGKDLPIFIIFLRSQFSVLLIYCIIFAFSVSLAFTVVFVTPFSACFRFCLQLCFKFFKGRGQAADLKSFLFYNIVIHMYKIQLGPKSQLCVNVYVHLRIFFDFLIFSPSFVPLVIQKFIVFLNFPNFYLYYSISRQHTCCYFSPSTFIDAYFMG